MDNAAIFLSQNNLAEFNVANTNVRQDTVDAQNPNQEVDTEDVTTPETDSIEFSRESISLARLNADPVVEEAFLAENEATAALLMQPEVLEAVSNNTGEPEVSEDTSETGDTVSPFSADNFTSGLTTGITGAITTSEPATILTQETTTVATATSINLNPEDVNTDQEPTGESIRESLQSAAEADASQSVASPFSNLGQAATANAPANIPEAVEIEEAESIAEENPNLLDIQGNQLSQTNAVLNTPNRLAPPTAAEANAPPDAPRNEEPILLQNVGTQIAQSIPPSSIISLLG
ncbi:MAG: hypothetical protein GY757_01795 [bacterium]|nr:hypothetical protein [bacterium]